MGFMRRGIECATPTRPRETHGGAAPWGRSHRAVGAWLCAWALSGGHGAVWAAPAVFADAVAQGNNARLSLSASFTPDSAHGGLDLRVFVLAWVPSSVSAQGPQGRWFARTPEGWVPVATGEVWPQWVALAPTPQSHATQTLPVLEAEDMRTFLGADIYVGYGVSAGTAGAAAGSAMAEMLAQHRYRHVYTLNQSPSDTGRSTGEVGLEPTNADRLQALFAQIQKNTDTGSWAYLAGSTTGAAPTTATGVPPASVPAPAPAASAPSAAPVVSGTTLQEVGVDEDDAVKSDGVSLYSLDGSSSVSTAYNNPRDLLQRRRFNTHEATLSEAQRLPLPWSQGVVGTGLFLDTERQQVIAIAQGGINQGVYNMWFSSPYWQSGITEVAVVDSAADLQIKRHLRLSGALVGSRRIGSTLYLVLRSHPQWPVSYPPVFAPSPTPSTTPSAPPVAASRATDTSRNSTPTLPTLTLDQGVAQPLVNAADCLVPKTSNDNRIAPPSADTITLVAVDLTASTHRHAARCFVGSTEAFYMSERNIYLATTRHAYTQSGGFPVYSQDITTDIHQFSLQGLEMNYQGSGSVQGHLGFDQNRKSFRMGEHNGVLRVFTQTAQRFGGWVGRPTPVPMPAVIGISTTATTTTATADDSPGKLTLLQLRDGALVKVGELPNAQRPAPLGKPGEQLYASRFLGNRGYLVTYRLIDPLYIIDLSDPTDPRILGELEVSGYSDYLFPLSDTLLLGVGKEAVADGSAGDGRAAWYQGVKLSLIDLSNPSQPAEVARRIIGQRGTDATVLHNHHGIALQVRTGSVRVGLPISLNDTPSSYMTGKPWDHYDFTRTELQKFEIDVNAKTLTPRSPLTAKGPQRDISADRSVLWNEQVHYYTGNDWVSAPW